MALKRFEPFPRRRDKATPPPHDCRHSFCEFKKFGSAVEKDALFDCSMQIDDAEAKKKWDFLILTIEVSKQSCRGGPVSGRQRTGQLPRHVAIV